MALESRQETEVHAVDARNQGRRQEHGRRDREDLDDVVLLDVDQAERRLEHEARLVGEERGVVRQRRYVALHAAVARDLFLRQLDRGRLQDERQLPRERDEALTRLAGQVAVAADALADSSSRPMPTRSRTSAVRSTMDSRRPARMPAALVAADG